MWIEYTFQVHIIQSRFVVIQPPDIEPPQSPGQLPYSLFQNFRNSFFLCCCRQLNLRSGCNPFSPQYIHRFHGLLKLSLTSQAFRFRKYHFLYCSSIRYTGSEINISGISIFDIMPPWKILTHQIFIPQIIFRIIQFQHFPARTEIGTGSWKEILIIKFRPL